MFGDLEFQLRKQHIQIKNEKISVNHSYSCKFPKNEDIMTELGLMFIAELNARS